MLRDGSRLCRRLGARRVLSEFWNRASESKLLDRSLWIEVSGRRPRDCYRRKPLKNSLLLAFQYRPAKAVLHESIAYALDSCRVIPAPEKTSSFFRGFLRSRRQFQWSAPSGSGHSVWRQRPARSRRVRPRAPALPLPHIRAVSASTNPTRRILPCNSCSTTTEHATVPNHSLHHGFWAKG